MTRYILALAAGLLGAACADPFDPMAWRLQTATVCVFTLGGDPPPSCYRRTCEVRGVERRPPSNTAVVNWDDGLEYRSCWRES
jgi:hypothetical protein